MTLHPRILTYSPSGTSDFRVAVAGSRAGGLGVLDLGAHCDVREARRAIRELGRLLKGGGRARRFGIRVSPSAEVGKILDGAPASLTVVVTAGDEGSEGLQGPDEVHRSGRTALAEVTSRAAALRAARLGFDGLILAGNEAGGHVSDESAFIFLQAVLAELGSDTPVWVRGGIGPNAAAGCIAAGATGVVLDGTLLLARESPLTSPVRERVATWDGVETTVLGPSAGPFVRVYAAPGSETLKRLREAEATGGTTWVSAVDELVGWGPDQAWPVGQDAAFAAGLARQFVTVGGIVQEVERAIDQGLKLARETNPLAENSTLAASHGTRYPIVQGPMTRVSDRPAFAKAVADGGALPFLALAMMRGAEVRSLLAEASETLRGQAWGAGILGFLPPEHRREQSEAILEARPPFVLIAGGRPDQARPFEEAGLTTYLHVPSPGLLSQFLKGGSRRFVLEGRECGGHVGPRSSFVLWEQASRVLMEAIQTGVDPREVHILFAGGIHDARSAAVVSAFAAPLAAKGVRIGVLIGTANLFTTEAVESGAIVAGFQGEAIACAETVLLETGPGHLVRVSPTPFADRFERERQRLIAEGKSSDDVRDALEGLNVGRLRVAAKGVDRGDGVGSPLVDVTAGDQRENGVYMLGQAATLRAGKTAIAELHREIAAGSSEWIEKVSPAARRRKKRRSRPSDIAIIGMSAVVPGATDVRSFWENTLRSHDAITEVPSDRWDWKLYYDADPKAPDKIISRWGGFVPDIPFDPLQYGMPPTSLPSIEPLHLITLEAVRSALEDAGYRDRAFPKERTGVVLGAGGGAAQLSMGYAFRSYLPLLDTVMPGVGSEAMEKLGQLLPEWTEDSFPGILLNVAAGRVANRFDLGGTNFTVDAACGSSLAAASLAVRELESGAADMVVLGGADTVQNPFTYLAFSKTHAFSPRGRCRPFDASADGIVISEGVAVVILKRLADAERDGDRIYAVIKGVGASSDGRAKGLTAPRFEGQVRALRRAYEKSRIEPSTVEYVECHGTGTSAGDLAEVQGLTKVFSDAGASTGSCAVGSVKSLIGHTKCAAGLAGLINAALALKHRVLPPTIGVENLSPRANFPESPFHVSTRPRPWLRHDPASPRRAGVSAFGFGGTNFHAVLEAYEGDATPAAPAVLDWPAELFVWQAHDRAGLLEVLDRFDSALSRGPVPALRDLAHTLIAAIPGSATGPRLAIVAETAGELSGKLRQARELIRGGRAEVSDPSGIFYDEKGRWRDGRVAFLFPGQGSQYPGMLGELALLFPEVMDGFESVDSALARLGRPAIGPKVFPAPKVTDEEFARQKVALAAPDVAQPALGAASVGMLALLKAFGLEPDAAAGHSYGEFVALHSAGVYSRDALAELSVERGRFLMAAGGDEPGGMAAIGAGAEMVESFVNGTAGVVLANRNGPSQTVVSGPTAAVEKVVATAKERGFRAQSLSVACAFHSPLVAAASTPLRELAAKLEPHSPELPVYSNVTAAPYGPAASQVAAQLGEHLAKPVRFSAMIDAMHKDEARVFIEVGAGSVLTALVGSILGDRPHLAVACDPHGKKGLPGFLATLGRLFVGGVANDLSRLTAERSSRRVKWDAAGFEPTAPVLSPSTWMVNGTRARPILGPEAPRFGNGPALPKPEPAAAAAETAEPPQLDRAAPKTRTRPRSEPMEAASFAAQNGHAAPPPASDGVFEAFQSTMRNFLDVQRTTMLGYFATEPAAAPIPPQASTNGDGHHEPPEVVPIPVPVVARHDEGPHETNGHVPVEAVMPAPAEAEAENHPVERRLLTIVRERTGYPEEMLGLDLDLEADLGIDSIKRVEILGTLRDSLPTSLNGSEAELMDQLSRAKTLGAIVKHVNSHLGNGHGGAPSHNGHGAHSAKGKLRKGHSGVRRMLLRAKSAPLPDGFAERSLPPGSLVLITDDRRGIARCAAARLQERGFKTLLVGQSGAADVDVVSLDFRSPDAVAMLAERVRAEGSVGGVLHALPLRDAPKPGLDAAQWQERMAIEVRGLYLLARALGDDLATTALQGGARFVAATAMGGGFASVPSDRGGAGADFFAGHGGIAGLVKTLAREWLEVGARVVDLDPREAADLLAARLVDELLTHDDRSEVGYLGGRRIALKAVETELDGFESGGVSLEEGDPILITGGARGITAAMAADLARRWRPTLLIVGSSAPPALEDASDLAGVVEPAAIKARLLQRLGRGVAPADLERVYQTVKREREIRENMANLRRSGANVEYAQIDVRDVRAMAEALGRWRAKFGPLKGLVHGAGVIHDKLLRDKTPESFDRVVGTKLDGALTLARLVEPDSLKFAAFFSSVAGRFGNRGQADYAAANDVLNKLALWLDRRWAGRVVSMIWGPWSGVGMVSDLEGHLGRQGFGMIDPADGRTRLGDELVSGRKGDVEVIVAGELGSLVEEEAAEAQS